MTDTHEETGFAPWRWTRRLISPPPLINVLRLSGIIADSSGALRGAALSHHALAPAIGRAFTGRGLAAVVLQINSPGGSPVQSALIGQHIRRLAERKNVPVLAFVEDVAASGGYWLALAADEIYANASSIIGSIGVISSSFGFAGLIDKLGVERRVHTAGTEKSFLDPFVPERAADIERLTAIQQEIHGQFIDWVKTRRGSKLKQPENPSLFSGAFWTGAGALDLGLIDALGDLGGTLWARYGKTARIRFVNPPRSGWLRRRLGLSLVDAAEDGALALEHRLARARFGL